MGIFDLIATPRKVQGTIHVEPLAKVRETTSRDAEAGARLAPRRVMLSGRMVRKAAEAAHGTRHPALRPKQSKRRARRLWGRWSTLPWIPVRVGPCTSMQALDAHGRPLKSRDFESVVLSSDADEGLPGWGTGFEDTLRELRGY